MLRVVRKQLNQEAQEIRPKLLPRQKGKEEKIVREAKKKQKKKKKKKKNREENYLNFQTNFSDKNKHTPVTQTYSTMHFFHPTHLTHKIIQSTIPKYTSKNSSIT